MLVELYDEDRHKPPDSPLACEIIYNNSIFGHVSTQLIAGFSEVLFKETPMYRNADDTMSRDIKFPKCCGDIRNCINSISSFIIMDLGGITVEKEQQETD
jgi:hypothetical protein